MAMPLQMVKSTGERSSIPFADRLYARVFALTVRSEPTEAAITELIGFSEGNPHLLGQVRERFVVLAREHPDSIHADRAVALATCAWLAAVAAAA